MKNKRIHLIDDEKIIHDIFQRIFKNDPYDLTISENKSQAKTNHSSNIDVVILDLMIPGTSGIEIFKELKKIDPDIKVIFLTAYGTIESAIEAIQQYGTKTENRAGHQGKKHPQRKHSTEKGIERALLL